MSQNILIAGASGCVGHYLVEELVTHPGYHLYLLVRNRAKLKFNPDQWSNVTILDAGLGDFERYQHVLSDIDFVVNLAAAWGDPQETMNVNVNYPLQLYAMVNPDRCQRIIHFSTASILNRHNQLLPEAQSIGTDYIRTKFLCYQAIMQSSFKDRIITMFPTLILGGAKDKPYSHVCNGLPELIKWYKLIQWLRCDASFHYIHAHDIGTIIGHVLRTPVVPKLLVLGNPNITVDECIAQVGTYLGKRAPWTFELSLERARSMVKWLPIDLAPWDEFCMAHRHFQYETVNAATFGLPVLAGTMGEVLDLYGFSQA